MKKAIYPGSFDPVTLGHIDIIERSSKLFDRVTVLVSINRKKTPMFTEVERKALVEASIGHLDNVDVVYDDGLLVDYVEANNYDVIVKGLRAISDFEAEFQMAAINRRLKAVDTVFIMTRTEYMYISSSVVKEVHSFGGEIGQFVSPVVKEAMIQKGRA